MNRINLCIGRLLCARAALFYWVNFYDNLNEIGICAFIARLPEVFPCMELSWGRRVHNVNQCMHLNCDWGNAQGVQCELLSPPRGLFARRSQCRFGVNLFIAVRRPLVLQVPTTKVSPNFPSLHFLPQIPFFGKLTPFSESVY